MFRELNQPQSSSNKEEQKSPSTQQQQQQQQEQAARGEPTSTMESSLATSTTRASRSTRPKGKRSLSMQKLPTSIPNGIAIGSAAAKLLVEDFASSTENQLCVVVKQVGKGDKDVLQFHLDPSASVLDLKTLIAKESPHSGGVPVERQRLIFYGKLLNDNNQCLGPNGVAMKTQGVTNYVHLSPLPEGAKPSKRSKQQQQQQQLATNLDSLAAPSRLVEGPSSPSPHYNHTTEAFGTSGSVNNMSLEAQIERAHRLGTAARERRRRRRAAEPYPRDSLQTLRETATTTRTSGGPSQLSSAGTTWEESIAPDPSLSSTTRASHAPPASTTNRTTSDTIPASIVLAAAAAAAAAAAQPHNNNSNNNSNNHNAYAAANLLSSGATPWLLQQLGLHQQQQQHHQQQQQHHQQQQQQQQHHQHQQHHPSHAFALSANQLNQVALLEALTNPNLHWLSRLHPIVNATPIGLTRPSEGTNPRDYRNNATAESPPPFYLPTPTADDDDAPNNNALAATVGLVQTTLSEVIRQTSGEMLPNMVILETQLERLWRMGAIASQSSHYNDNNNNNNMNAPSQDSEGEQTPPQLIRVIENLERVVRDAQGLMVVLRALEQSNQVLSNSNRQRNSAPVQQQQAQQQRAQQQASSTTVLLPGGWASHQFISEAALPPRQQQQQQQQTALGTLSPSIAAATSLVASQLGWPLWFHSNGSL